jgi:uncharacterized glyoxalase superfamily protein PhnB
MNNFRSVTPMLWTDKLAETLEFYKHTLGFTVNEFSEEWGWAAISRDNVNLMLARPNEHGTFENGAKFTGSFYIRVDNADDLWEKLKVKTKVCYSIENFDWGMREFAIYDNNGYILQFGHEINSDQR